MHDMTKRIYFNNNWVTQFFLKCDNSLLSLRHHTYHIKLFWKHYHNLVLETWCKFLNKLSHLKQIIFYICPCLILYQTVLILLSHSGETYYMIFSHSKLVKLKWPFFQKCFVINCIKGFFFNTGTFWCWWCFFYVNTNKYWLFYCGLNCYFRSLFWFCSGLFSNGELLSSNFFVMTSGFFIIHSSVVVFLNVKNDAVLKHK